MTNTAATRTARTYDLVTLGRGRATHVAGPYAHTTACCTDWNLALGPRYTRGAGVGVPTCKTCRRLVGADGKEQLNGHRWQAIADAVRDLPDDDPRLLAYWSAMQNANDTRYPSGDELDDAAWFQLALTTYHSALDDLGATH